MRLWRVISGRRIAPFGDAVEDAFLFPGCLAEQQEELCRRRSIEHSVIRGDGPLEVGPGLVLFDDAYVNGPALDHFVRETRAPGLAALGLGPGPLRDFVPALGTALELDGEGVQAVGLFMLDQRVRADDAEALRRRLCEQARTVALPQQAGERERLPGFPGHRPELILPRGAAIAGRIEHWAQILWLNQAAAYSPEDRASRDRRGNRIAASARVHPTAYLERARVDAHAIVEPHATIIDSCVGPHCHIGDHTVLIGCTLGHHCHTLTDTYLRRVVSYPDSTLSSLGLEEVLVGRAVFLTAAVIFFPTVAGEAPTLDVEGSARSGGRPRIGGCIGHRAVLGARAIFQPGRVVENGYTVVMRPEEGVGRIDASLADGRPACWHQGQLLAVADVAPGYAPPELDET